MNKIATDAEAKPGEIIDNDPLGVGYKPKATISVNGGPKIDAFSNEGQKLLASTVAQIAEGSDTPTVSINDGPAYPLGSQEAEEAVQNLRARAAINREDGGALQHADTKAA